MKGWKKAALIVGILFAGMALLCGGILTFFAYVFQAASAGPQDVEISVDVPERVVVDEEFPIVISLRNTRSTSQRLAGLDLFDSYTQGIEVLASDPPWNREDSIFDFTSYYYSLTLPPGQAIRLSLKCRGKKPGYFSGDLDVCINNDYACDSFSARTLVLTTEQDRRDPEATIGGAAGVGESAQKDRLDDKVGGVSDVPPKSPTGRKPLPSGDLR